MNINATLLRSIHQTIIVGDKKVWQETVVALIHLCFFYYQNDIIHSNEFLILLIISVANITSDKCLNYFLDQRKKLRFYISC